MKVVSFLKKILTIFKKPQPPAASSPPEKYDAANVSVNWARIEKMLGRSIQHDDDKISAGCGMADAGVLKKRRAWLKLKCESCGNNHWEITLADASGRDDDTLAILKCQTDGCSNSVHTFMASNLLRRAQ